MITRKVKLKLNRKNGKILEKYLYQLTGCFNWALSECYARNRAGLPYGYFDLTYLAIGHSKKACLPQRAIMGTIKTAQRSAENYFKKIFGKPKRKGLKNKLNSILFTGNVKINTIENYIKLPNIGHVKFHKQDLPVAKLATEVRLIKKASGWYAVLLFDEKHSQEIDKNTKKIIGIDTGFKDLMVFSDGTKIPKCNELAKKSDQLAKVQRGSGLKKAAILQEKIANQRLDRNHKISHSIVRDYLEIYITRDNLKNMQKLFGKSILSAGIGQLRNLISYKSSSCGRKFVLVDSKFTTMTCSNCQARTGPTGLSKLNVRNWECKACSALHDRDINAAINILNSGQRYCLDLPENTVSGIKNLDSKTSLVG